MDISRFATSLFAVMLGGAIFLGVTNASAQRVQFEAGGGWAIPSSSVDMGGTIVSDVDTLDGIRVSPISVDSKSGPHYYGSIGLQWTLSSNFDLGLRLRGQRVRIRGDADEIVSALIPCREGACSVSNEPDGGLVTGTVEGRLVLTSVGRFSPYFMVGLGVVHTSIDGVLVEGVEVQGGDQTGTIEEVGVRFSDVSVTDAGGDVGFGTYFELAGGLDLVGELRATGSLPGAKENAITSFPFTLGLSYEF